MVSRTESQKIVIETRDENIDIEPGSLGFRSSLRGLVPLEITPQKDKFV